MNATLQLTKIRGKIEKIKNMMRNPNDNALYFVTGEYASDSYNLIMMMDELDKYLSSNDDAEELPLWWKIDPASTGRVLPDVDFDAILDGRVDPPNNINIELH
jgi:hypothetical protein